MTPPIFDAGKADPDGVPYNDYFTCKAEARLAHRLWALARYDLDRGAELSFPGDRPARPRRPSQSGGLFQKVKDAILLEEFAAKFTDLRPTRADRLKGLCPVHEEREGSFYIDVDNRPGAASAPAPQAAT